MKRFIFVFAVMLLSVSCFEDSGTTMSNTLYATFDYSYVSDSFDKDSIYVDGPFAWSGLIVFNNKVEREGETFKAFKGGFALSCLKGDVVLPEKDDEEESASEAADEGTDGGSEEQQPYVINPYRVYAPMGTANNYAVFFQTDDMPEHDFLFKASDVGTCVMKGCYVNNTVEVVDYVRKNFVPGDRITLKATGYLDGKMTGSDEINLADYSAQKDSVMTNWSVFNLTKLGSVDAVDFEITSNKEVPKSFCMDVMTVNVTLSY